MTRYLILLVFILTSCGGEPTQQERYDDAVSGITYRTYKATAGSTSASVISLYNDQKPDSVPPLTEGYAHLLLGYMWTVSGKSTLAFAEADLAEESPENDVKILAVALRSIAMYEMGLDSLGHSESQSMRKYVPASDTAVPYEITTFYLLMGIAKAYDHSYDESKFYLAGFANETGIHWPYQLMDAIADFQNGKTQSALQKLKALSQNPEVPAGLRTILGEQIKQIEAQTGDVNSPLFWPRLISKFLYAQLKESSSAQLNGILNLLEPDEKQ